MSIDNKFIGMGLAKIAILAEKDHDLDELELRTRLKKQSKEDEKEKQSRRKLNKLLDKLIDAGGFFESNSLTDKKAHKYNKLELEFIESIRMYNPDEDSENSLDFLQESTSPKEDQTQIDIVSFVCRKIHRFFEKLIARCVGWDVSKDTVIAKLLELKALRSRFPELACNKKTIEEALETTLRRWEVVERDEYENCKGRNENFVRSQYEWLIDNGESDYAMECRLENLELIQQEESEIESFCNNMANFFNTLVNQVVAENQHSSYLTACSSEIAKVEEELEKLENQLKTKALLVNKSELDKKLKQKDIRNLDGTLALKFKIRLTPDELDFLHVEKQIENYKFFKKFIELMQQTFPIGNQIGEDIKGLLKDFIRENFKDRVFPILGKLGEELIDCLNTRNDPLNNKEILYSVRLDITEILRHHIKRWMSGLEIKQRETQELLSEERDKIKERELRAFKERELRAFKELSKPVVLGENFSMVT